jgi:hypothetical protein
MKPERPFPCLQQAITGHFSEPDDSSPHLHTLHFRIYFNIILASSHMSSQLFLYIMVSE